GALVERPRGLLGASSERKRPRAHLLCRAAERIPFRETRPDVFAGGLSAGAKRRKIHAGDLPVLHTDDAVDERGFDVVRDAALDQTLDGIAHGAPAQRVAP